MHHAIMMVPEIAQKGRQHGGGLRPGIVQQDDPLVGGFEPPDERLMERPPRPDLRALA